MYTLHSLSPESEFRPEATSQTLVSHGLEHGYEQRAHSTTTLLTQEFSYSKPVYYGLYDRYVLGDI